MVRGPVERLDGRWGIRPFYIETVGCMIDNSYNFETETTHDNLYRLLRAMQLSRPILLEGSPGVGKTTLIEAMCQSVGKIFIRINLSDQTDMMDLLGANLPSPDGDAGEFVWSDGPLLQAMKTGSWVLLDELNLAGQSILEGLNALLDHRGEVFVPELNTVVKCAPGFRLFGAQNPVQEGGGRKGLPKSFLNRFVRVRISAFNFHDLLNISRSMYARIPDTVVRAMTECVWQCASKASYRGQSTLDFNLRDLLRWCKLVQGKLGERLQEVAPLAMDTGSDGLSSSVESEALRWSRFYGNMLLAGRMRSSEDRRWIGSLLDGQLVPASAAGSVDRFEVGPGLVKIGNVDLPRKHWGEVLRGRSFSFTGSESGATDYAILKSYFGVQESLSECVKNNWLSILVGSNGTGRSSSVAAVAHLMGKRLVEIPMHAGIDISDLLGGFEQVDVERESLAVLENVKTFLRSLAVVALHEGRPVDSLKDLWHEMFDHHVPDHQLQREARTAVATLSDNLGPFRKLIGKLSRQRGGGLAKDLEDLNIRGKRFLAREAQAAGKFEWVDGTLTRCILDGSWVILRDANLCNPSVLDRLNPLFEPGGFISLNECGSTDGGARAIVPHPEFRMFITYDPVSGEISRAMRNRGIEISMVVDISTGLPLGHQGTSSSVSDVVAVMVANALPGPVAQQLARRWLSDTSGIPSDRKSIQYLAKWSKMVNGLVGSGLTFGRAVELAYRQCFNRVVPVDFGVCDALLDQMASDMSVFMYPSLDDVSEGSRLEALLATWGYIVELGKGGGPAAPLSPRFPHLSAPGGGLDEWLVLLEHHGALAAMNMAGFASGAATDLGEDVMNAAMAICQSHVGTPALVGAVMDRIMTSPNRHPEMAAWKSFLAGTGAGPGATASHVVRTALEGRRMAQLAGTVPDSPNECPNLLEAAAWCHDHPFSQDHQLIKDASLLRWLWAALEALYASVPAAATEESCNALSLLRRVLMTNGKRMDSERLAHAWQRLVDSLQLSGSSARFPLLDGASALVEKVSGILRGPVGDTAPECADAFLETIGRPLVALNIELHDVLQQCHAVAGRLQTERGILETYRETGEAEETLLLTMIPGPREEVLEVLRIAMAGSITDPRSLPRLRRVLAQLKELVRADVLLRNEMSDRNSWDARVRLLRYDGAVEQLALVEELVVRRQETVLALRLENVSSLSSDYTLALSKCLEASRDLIEGATCAIAAMPSRTVSDCLPFQVLLDYHDVLMARGGGAECLTRMDIQREISDESRVMKGLRMMALLQVHRDLWSPQPLSARDSHLAHSARGSASLHQCGVTSSLIQLMNQGKMPSLRNRAARVMQIERCVSTALLVPPGGDDDLGDLEWKACLVTTTDMLRCICGVSQCDAWVDPSGDPREGHAAAVAALEAAAGIDRESSDLLKQSLDLILLHNSNKRSTESMINRGKALVLSSLVQLRLSRPYKAYDPSLAGEMERYALNYAIDHFYMPERRIRESYGHLPLSEPQLGACGAIDRRVAELEGRRGAISRLTSARPPGKSQYLALRDDISDFMSHLGEPSRIRGLLDALDGVGQPGQPTGAAARLQAELWCDNTHAFIETMNAKYPCYRDIIGPVELSLRGIQYGVGLMCSALAMEEVSGAEALARGLLTMPCADASFIEDHDGLEKVLDIVHRDASDSEGRTLSVLTDKLRLMALRVDAVRSSLELADSPGHRAALRDEFERVGLQIHRIWVEMVEQEKARLAEEEALYEVKARKLDMSKDDLQLQREMDVMFPEHVGKFFDDLAGDHDDECGGDNGGDGGAGGERTDETGEMGAQRVCVDRKHVSDMVLDAVYAAFCALNAVDRGAPSAPQESSALVTPAARFSIGVDMVSRLQGALSSMVDVVSIPGFSYMLTREWRALTAVADSPCDWVDMYSPSVEEASRVQKPLELLLNRLEQLLDEWPDHPILDQLRRISLRLLDMPLDCPLKSYSTGVELLLNKSQVWEETAPKHVALEELLKPLVSIAAHWRKLELNGWKDIVLRARQDIAMEAREAWFFIFGIIHENFGSMADFTNAMDSFVQGSPLGQYKERLALLQMFSSYLWDREIENGGEVGGDRDDDGERYGDGEASKRRTLSLVLGNLCRYYQQFQPTIDARIAADMNPLEKELADFVKLAKWEDRGFYAMKAAADKAHLQLCKIVRRVKDALETPASACLCALADQIGITADTGSAALVGESATAHLLESLEASVGPVSVDVPSDKVSNRLSESQLRLLGKYSRRVDGIADTFQRMVQGKDGALGEMRGLAGQMEGLSTAAMTQVRFGWWHGSLEW